MQGRRSAGIKDIGVNVTMAATVRDRVGQKRSTTSRSGWRTRGIQKERKKERKKVITRRDGQLPRTRSPNRFSEYVAGSRCMRIFKIVCYIRELLTIRFFVLRSPPRILLPLFALSALSNLRQPSLPRTQDVYARDPQRYLYIWTAAWLARIFYLL